MSARHGRRVAHQLCLTAVLALMVGTSAAPAQAAEVGVNSDITWEIPPSDIKTEVALIQQAGIKRVRVSVALSSAEYWGPGQLNTPYLDEIDNAVQSAQAAGLNVLMEFDRTPYWASADPSKYTDSTGILRWNRYWRYGNPQDYARVAADMVNRYRPLGVHSYEVWNEPNNASFWPSGVSAAEYVALLKAAYPAIKAADPTATVVMGGLMPDTAYGFLQGMYDAGARGYYDVANFHIYPGGDPTVCTSGADGRPATDTFCLLQGLRSVMTSNGDSAPAWVTELGWSTCTSNSCVSQQQQADYIASAFNLLSASAYSWVRAAFVYQARDLYWDTANTTWESSLGILDRNFSPKPAYAALAAVARGGAASKPGSRVAVALSAPAWGARFGSSLPVAATATAAGGITKVTFALDGKSMATRSSSPFSASLNTKKVPDGTHTLTATAYGADGSTHTASVTVVKGAIQANVIIRRGMHITLTVHQAHLDAGLAVVTCRARLTGNATVARVGLLIQHRVHGRWRRIALHGLHRTSGGYVARLRIPAGLWRVWAANGDARSARHVVHVR